MYHLTRSSMHNMGIDLIVSMDASPSALPAEASLCRTDQSLDRASVEGAHQMCLDRMEWQHHLHCSSYEHRWCWKLIVHPPNILYCSEIRAVVVILDSRHGIRVFPIYD